MGNAVAFGPFRLDLQSGELCEAGVRVALQEQPFRLLALLVQRRGELVRREDLRWALWPDGTVVDFEHGLNTAIKRLREALKDPARAPRFIETLPRRGYRFIAAVEETASPPVAAPAALVGRARELQVLTTCLARARKGTRQCVFVTGEAGIGKSALVERFLYDAARSTTLAAGEGQALALHGASDAYGPVLDAVRTLALAYPPLVAVLAQHAPTWLPHLPSLAARSTSDEMIPRATRPRMLREMLAMLEAASAERLVVLVLEDLHWGDDSTVELVGALARGRKPAQLVVVCTYRPAEAVGREHQLYRVTQELKVQGHGVEIALRGVDAPAIQACLALRFPRAGPLAGLAEALHDRTDGNPLFVINCLDTLLSEGMLAEDEAGTVQVRCALDAVRGLLPPSLAELILLHVERLSGPEQELLQVASVIGVQFRSSLLAHVAGREQIAVDEALARLARRRDLIERVAPPAWPDGAPEDFRFAHALYQHALYERLAPERARVLHGRTAEAMEACSASPEAAPHLALHFDRARLPERAVPYYGAAADIALRRTAYTEGAQHVTRGLALLPHLAESVARDEQELGLQLRLGAALSGHSGYADARVERAFARALDLSRRLPDSPPLVAALLGLGRYFGSAGPARAAVELHARAVEHARRAGDTDLLFEALHHRAASEFFAGDVTAAGASFTEPIEVLSALGMPRLGFFLSGFDGASVCRSGYALVHWYIGNLGQALSVIETIHATAHPSSRAVVLAFVSIVESLDGTSTGALRHAEEAAALGAEHDMIVAPLVQLVLGRERWRRGAREQGSSLMRTTLERLDPSWLVLGSGFLAEVLIAMGAWDRGLDLVNRALAVSARTGICYHDAELLRLQAELLHSIDGGVHLDAVDESLGRALALARAQGSRWLELRVALSLCRLPREGDPDALRTLASIVDAFASGDDCADLRDARDLLASC